MGKVTGNIECSDRVDIRSEGVVNGNVSTEPHQRGRWRGAQGRNPGSERTAKAAELRRSPGKTAEAPKPADGRATEGAGSNRRRIRVRQNNAGIKKGTPGACPFSFLSNHLCRRFCQLLLRFSFTSFPWASSRARRSSCNSAARSARDHPQTHAPDARRTVRSEPRCAPSRKLRSLCSSTLPSSAGLKKLGQPVPESNFVEESNNGSPQQTQ